VFERKPSAFNESIRTRRDRGEAIND